MNRVERKLSQAIRVAEPMPDPAPTLLAALNLGVR